MMRHLTRYVFLVVLLCLCVSAMPSGVRAASQTVPWHPSWTLCRLAFGEHGGFQSKVCHHYQILHETRHPIAKTWREVERTPSLSVRVTWPRFEQPQPVYATTGGCFDVVPAVSVQTGIPAAILRGLIRTESGGSASVPGGNGSVGCGQPIPQTFAAYAAPGCTNPYIPYCNVQASARYLATLVAMGHGMTWALAAYNGGPGNPQYGYAAIVLSRSY